MGKPGKGIQSYSRTAIAFTVLSFALFSSGVIAADSLVGKKAPEIVVSEWITDDALQAKDLTGRVYAIEFWATWCRPCVEGVPHLIKLYNKYRPQGFEFIGLSADNSAQKVREFVRKKGINYHVGMDKGTRDWFHVRYYPTAAVVNHLGVVVWQGFPWEDGFKRAIVKALAAAPRPLLADVDIGPFAVHRDALFGGSRFLRAYRLIESYTSDKEDPETAQAAKRIMETINFRIGEMTSLADSLRAEKPQEAYAIYVDIAAKYDGIRAAEPAEIAYNQMKPSRKPQILALEGVIRTVNTIEVKETK